MEQLIAEVERYAEAVGLVPNAVLRRAIGAGWSQWDDWKGGKSSPTMRVADRLRAYMAANPPAPKTKDVA